MEDVSGWSLTFERESEFFLVYLILEFFLFGRKAEPCLAYPPFGRNIKAYKYKIYRMSVSLSCLQKSQILNRIELTEMPSFAARAFGLMASVSTFTI